MLSDPSQLNLPIRDCPWSQTMPWACATPKQLSPGPQQLTLRRSGLIPYNKHLCYPWLILKNLALAAIINRLTSYGPTLLSDVPFISTRTSFSVDT